MKLKSLKSLLFVLIIIFAAFFSLNNIRKIKEILSRQTRLKDLQTEVAKLIQENEKLHDELKRASSLEFLEKEARNKLGMIKQDEKMVILPNFDNVLGQSTPSSSPQKSSNFFQRVLQFFGNLTKL